MKAKKAVAVAASAIMAASAVGALAGCGKDREHTIEVFLLANYTESVFYDKYFEEMEEQLKEEGYDYAINFIGEQEDNYHDALKGYINRDATPDIFYVRPNDILQYKDEIASLQSFADAQDYVDLDDIYDIALDMYRYNPETGELGNPDDEIYAFPKDLSTQQLGYNKTLLEQYQQEIRAAGLKMPWEMDFTRETYTWDQYMTMCKTIADNKKDVMHYACDVPSVEVLAHSFGGELIDLSEGRANGTVASLTDTNGAMYKAIRYQAQLVDCGAADYQNATYANFTAGRVCFYGLVGSWEVTDYNDHLGDGNWELMPWPTTDGGTDWAGTITSAGYVVSKDCAATEKGEIAKRIAISFMTSYAQNRLVRDEQISLPLRKSVEDDYKNPENNDIYKPATRSIFLDVVSGEHGFFPAKYSTYDDVWLDQLDTALGLMWNEGKGKALSYFGSANWADIQAQMQAHYNESKNK